MRENLHSRRVGLESKQYGCVSSKERDGMLYATNFWKDRISHKILVNLDVFAFITYFRFLWDALVGLGIVVEGN